MAKIKLSAFMAEIRGAVSGTVFSRGHYGAFARTKISPINPDSLSQQLVRGHFKSLTPLWSGLSDSQRQLWEALADRHPRKNVFGETITMTGFNMFMSLNGNLKSIGEAINQDAPIIVPVESFETFSVEVDTTPGTEDIKLNLSPAIDVNTKVIVYATPVLNNGKKFVDGLYRQIGVIDHSFLTGDSIKTLYTNVFGAMPKTGQKTYYKVKAVAILSGSDGLKMTTSAIGSL